MVTLFPRLIVLRTSPPKSRATVRKPGKRKPPGPAGPDPAGPSQAGPPEIKTPLDLGAPLRVYKRGEYLLGYTLPESLQFSEQAFARLIEVIGLPKPVLVYSDFTEAQFFNSELRPLIGCSDPVVSSPWVPITSNFVPNTGFIRVENANRTPIGSDKTFIVVIEVAPLSWVHGTKGARRI